MEITKNNLDDLINNQEFSHLDINGIRVYYTKNTLASGSTDGQDFLRIFKEYKFKPKRLFEWCSGCAFIAFSLLANGYCDSLCLADINKEAVACCLKTIHENNLYEKVTLYHSDCFDNIPETEQWDMVVGNPPHFHEVHDEFRTPDLLYLDVDWDLHRRFYSQITKYIKPNGLILNTINIEGSNIETFRGFIEKNGFEVIYYEQAPFSRDIDIIYYIGCVKKGVENPFT